MLWVKGSGSDLATIQAAGFTGLRLAEILPLVELEEMSDEDMVAYLGRCQLDPKMPRASIETLLHAFVPHVHVDHTHPDAIGAIVGAVDGERLAGECFDGEAIWIPYLRPGFALSRLVAEAVRDRPEAKLVLLAKHGLVTWGDTPEASYESTLDAVGRAAAFVRAAPEREPGAGSATAPRSKPEAARRRCSPSVLPLLRGAVSVDGPRILQVDTSPAVVEFVSSGRGGRAVAGRRRLPRPSRAHQAAAALDRVRSRDRGRRRSSAPGSSRASAPSRSGSARTSRSTVPRTTGSPARARASC